MSELVRTSRDDGLVTVTLNRPESRNALSAELIAELTETFRGLSADPALRVVVLAGEGRDFCSGADLGYMRELGAASPEENRADAERLTDLFRAIHDLPHPVVARVQGNVFGGGAGLLAAADVAVAARHAHFAFTEVRLGILPAVVSPFVVRRIGDGNARRLFLTGERFDAEHARAIGLVAIVVEDDELDDAVASLVRELLKGSPDAQRRIKLLLDAIEETPLEEASRRTPEFIAEARASDEGQEGLSAFFEKRKPRWAPKEGS